MLILRKIHLPKKLLLSLSKDCWIKLKNAVHNKLCFSSWGKKKASIDCLCILPGTFLILFEAVWMALEEQKYSLFLEVIFHFVNEGTGKSQLAGMVRKCTYKEKQRGQLRRELCGHLYTSISGYIAHQLLVAKIIQMPNTILNINIHPQLSTTL